LNGFLVLDKPAGPTSFACVSRIRRLLGARRVGHTGTLDPQARGVLILLIGSATKMQEQFLALPKQYAWQAEFGRKTSTGDDQGELIEQKPWQDVTLETLRSVCRQFTGTIQQIPPIYSALKYKGKPYYRYARQGLDVPRVARPVTIYSIDVLSATLPAWQARVVCSRGTYVRTLVEDIAERLGTVGTLIHLIREKVGEYGREQALPWSAVEENDQERLLSAIRPVTIFDEAVSHA